MTDRLVLSILRSAAASWRQPNFIAPNPTTFPRFWCFRTTSPIQGCSFRHAGTSNRTPTLAWTFGAFQASAFRLRRAEHHNCSVVWLNLRSYFVCYFVNGTSLNKSFSAAFEHYCWTVPSPTPTEVVCFLFSPWPRFACINFCVGLKRARLDVKC